MNESNVGILSVITLPKELIYAIAAVDVSVYNRILRLCRATASLFPLSIRLDFMIGFGVTVKLSPGDIYESCRICWCWRGERHDVFGPAVTRMANTIKNTTGLANDISHYYRGKLHKLDGPAMVWHNGVAWYHHGKHHRQQGDSSGTGVGWLDGVTWLHTRGFNVGYASWSVDGIFDSSHDITDVSEVAQARAEIAYWRARE